MTLSLRGEIDIASAPLLWRELQDAARPPARRIVLDLAALDFIDSSGIRALLEAHDHADSSGGALVLTNVPPRVRELFRLTGLDARIPIA